MARIQENLALADKITVHTMRGKEDSVIGRLPSGRVVLFDKKSEYFNLLAPGQSVDCYIIYIHENFIIVDPISKPEEVSEPEEIEFVYIPEIPEVYVDDIVDELEKMIETLSGNAKVIPRALLKVIRLEQIIIRILLGEA